MELWQGSELRVIRTAGGGGWVAALLPITPQCPQFCIRVYIDGHYYNTELLCFRASFENCFFSSCVLIFVVFCFSISVFRVFPSHFALELVHFFCRFSFFLFFFIIRPHKERVDLSARAVCFLFYFLLSPRGARPL